MGFEEFDRKGSKRGVPKIRISSNGQLILNAACIREYISKGFSQAILFTDKESNKIGIKPIEKELDNSFTISYGPGKKIGSISGNSVLKHMNINYKKAENYAPEWDNEKKMIIIDLNKKGRLG